ncbi:MAG: efflux RND transporter periplasmic adaptor subunit [Gemmatimonadota bacterium]
MTGKTKVILGGGVLGLLALSVLVPLLGSRDQGHEVRVEAVEIRDLVATVTANGSIRARRSVNISSDVMGRVLELPVNEGDEVTQGDLLLRLDPAQFRAAVSRSQAALAQTRAQAAQQRANLLQAIRERDRLRELAVRDQNLVRGQQMDDAETQVEVATALLEAAEHGVAQAQAGLEEAEDQLSRTIIRSPIAGRVTRKNIEEGEMAVVGTMNNPGSLLLTVSDLAVMEVVLVVDETDIPRVAIGQEASVELDAFPGQMLRGRITEIGNSAIRSASATGGTASTQSGSTVDFEVVVTLEEPPTELRPDLSATAEIRTQRREGVPTIPIIALTLRDSVAGEPAGTAAEEGSLRRGTPGVEGVFQVLQGQVTFVPVEVGIAGQEYFEVVSGVSPGDSVVAGPYQSIRELRDGDNVRRLNDEG